MFLSLHSDFRIVRREAETAFWGHPINLLLLATYGKQVNEAMQVPVLGMPKSNSSLNPPFAHPRYTKRITKELLKVACRSFGRVGKVGIAGSRLKSSCTRFDNHCVLKKD